MADAGPAIRISIDADKVVAMLARAPERLERRVGQLVEGAAIDIQREMRLVAPVAVTGDLRRSVRYTFSPAALRAEIIPAVDYASDVENGAGPRWVSVASPDAPLRKWAVLKGLNPYAVRNSIAKKGTQAHPFVRPTYDKMKPVVEAQIGAGIAALIEELDHGGI